MPATLQQSQHPPRIFLVARLSQNLSVDNYHSIRAHHRRPRNARSHDLSFGLRNSLYVRFSFLVIVA